MNYLAAQAAENHGDSEAWPDTYDDVRMHQFQPEPTHKIQKHRLFHLMRVITHVYASTRATGLILVKNTHHF